MFKGRGSFCAEKGVMTGGFAAERFASELRKKKGGKVAKKKGWLLGREKKRMKAHNVASLVLLAVCTLASIAVLAVSSLTYTQVLDDRTVSAVAPSVEPSPMAPSARQTGAPPQLPEKSNLDANTSVYQFLDKAYGVFRVPKKGLLHVGAHLAQELDIYEHFALPRVMWVEADPELAAVVRDKIEGHPRSSLSVFAASDTNGRATFHRTSNGCASSSLLKFARHAKHFPNVSQDSSFEVDTKKLDDEIADKDNYNMIVIDIQGAEILALRGAKVLLRNIDAIVAEVNFDQMYAGGAMASELDTFLRGHGFTRADTASVCRAYGDALYVKDRFFK